MAAKHTVLIIDDDPMARKTLSDILRVKGYAPLTVATGATALDRVREEAPDVAVIDLKLEDMSGLELMGEIRKRASGTECIVLTGNASQASAIEAVNLGVYGYLQKPYDVEQLLIAIRRAIERREGREALRESEERYRAIFQQAADSIVLIDAQTGETVEFNDKAHHNLGYSREEFAELKVSDLEVIESPEQVAAHIERIVQEGADTFETRHRTKGGEVRDILVSSRAVSIRGRDFVQSIWGDITERKQAEERMLRQSTVLEAINSVFQEALVCETSAEVARTCLAVAEELTASKFGFIGELNETGLFDTTAISNPGWDACRVPHSDAVKLTQNMPIRGIDRATLRGGESRIVNDPASHPDSVGIPEGHPPVTCFLGVPLRQSGRTIGMIGLANKKSGYDLADQEAVEALSVAFVEALMRKRTEEGLRESEERYRTLVDTSPVAVATTDLEGRITYLSRRALELYGAESAEALPGKSILQLIAPEEHGRATATMETALTERVVRGTEFSFIRRDETHFAGELNVGVLRDLAGEPMGFVDVIRDVTERVQAENALRAGEQRYRGLFDGVPVGLYRTTPDGRILDANPALVEMLGCPDRESLLAVRAVDLFVDPEARVRQQALLERTGEVRDFAVRLRRLDGTEIWAEDSGRIVRDAEGRALYYEGSMKDITERRQTLEALRSTRDQLQRLLDSSPAVIYSVKVDGDYAVTSISENIKTQLGYEPRDFVEDPAFWAGHIHPEDAPRVFAGLEDLYERDKHAHMYRFLAKNGTYRWMQGDLALVRDPEGNPVEIVGSWLDITERVRAEEERERLLVAERDQRLLAEALREVAAAVNSSLELQEVLSLALKHLSRLVECDSAVVMLRAGDGLEVVARWSADPEREPQVPPQIETLPHVACVLGECQPVIIPDTVGDERWIEVPGSEYVRCWLGVPLIVQEKAIGLLGLNYQQPGFYTQEHADLALAVASQAASAIENAHLFEETRRRAAQQEALLRSAGRLNTRLELEAVLKAVGEETTRAFGVSGTSVYLYDPQRQVLTCAGAPGLSSEQRQRLPPVPRALYDKLSRQGETPIVIPDVQLAPGLPGSELFAELGFRTNVTALMKHGEELIGALNATTVDEVRSFSDDELALLQGLADQAAMAIANTFLLKAAREQAQQVQQILRTVPEGIVLLGAALRVLVVNPVGHMYLEALNGARPGGVLAHLGGRPLTELLSPPLVGRWHTIEAEGPPSRVFEVTARLVGSEAERSGWVLVLRDVTEERRIEDQMRQQDRLAAIGQLAGGVAHDFNNVLTAIEGYSELALSGLASDDPQDWPSGREMRADLGEVVKAAERAAGLTRQLLAFSRRQVLQPRVLSLNTVIAGFEKMLHRLLGEDIELVTFLAPEVGRVEADPGQIEQVIMNLAVNARDAMPGGGRLTLETANVTLDEVYARAHVEVEPGPYVMLAVSDTGIGMSEEVKTRVFEPFFTTKGKDKGTGLGLSVVHGIVKQSGGHISAYSEPGVGTTFKVYLPLVEKDAEVAERERVSRVPLGGTETVLVAEDEEAVRALACRVLREHGHTVLEAGHPEDALRLASEHMGPIHLLLTDVVMPGMSGRELAERLSPSHPGVAVLYISGYTDNAIVHHGVLDAGTPFLQKPFNTLTLARKVREVLDASLPGARVEQSQADLDAQRLRAGDETPETPASETAGAVSLTHESLAGLPADLVAAMREATINADIDRLNELIDRVETRDAHVAAELRMLASRYQNDTLLDLFGAGEGEP